MVIVIKEVCYTIRWWGGGGVDIWTRSRTGPVGVAIAGVVSVLVRTRSNERVQFTQLPSG